MLNFFQTWLEMVAYCGTGDEIFMDQDSNIWSDSPTSSTITSAGS